MRYHLLGEIGVAAGPLIKEAEQSRRRLAAQLFDYDAGKRGRIQFGQVHDPIQNRRIDEFMIGLRPAGQQQRQRQVGGAVGELAQERD